MDCASLTGLRIKENKEVYEGEVTELTPEETENQTGGYGKVVSHVIIGLKSVKGIKQLKLDPTIFDSLQKERVHVRSQLGAVLHPYDQWKDPFYDPIDNFVAIELEATPPLAEK